MIGCLLAAGISRWASALDGLARDLLGDPAFPMIVERDLQDGQHRNPTGRPDYFTTAYFHRPDELADEVLGRGFRVARVLEWEAAVISCSAHLLAVARQSADKGGRT